jgi:hypothetical protein
VRLVVREEREKFGGNPELHPFVFSVIDKEYRKIFPGSKAPSEGNMGSTISVRLKARYVTSFMEFK